MAEAPQNIENIAKNAPQEAAGEHGEQKEEKKPVSTLESAVNETFHLAGNAVKLGLAAAIPATQAIFGSQLLHNPLIARDTAIMTGAQIAGDFTTDLKRGKKYTAGSILESSIFGTAVAIPLHYAFKVAHTIPLDTTLGYIAKAGYWSGVAYPLYIGTYQFLGYLIRNRGFSGVGKYMKENYWPALKKSWKYLLPISLLNVFLAPPILNVPIAAALSYFFTLFGAPKTDKVKDEDKRDKTPYLVATSNVLGRLGKNTAKGIYDTAYGIGAGVRNLYDSGSKAVSSAAPAAAAPAHP